MNNLYTRGLAGILLVMFLSVFLLKDLHSHNTVHSCVNKCSKTQQENNSNEHNPEDCFICKFLFSPFIAEANLTYTFSQSAYAVIETEMPETLIISDSFSFNLRAPPGHKSII